MWRVLIALVVLVVATSSPAWATHCRWVVDPASTLDVISAMNREGGADNVEFQIFDNSGTMLGGTFQSPLIAAGGRFEITVGNVYASAGVSTALLRKTYILVREVGGFETILQVKTGRETFQPLHFDSGFSGTGSCDQH